MAKNFSAARKQVAVNPAKQRAARSSPFIPREVGNTDVEPRKVNQRAQVLDRSKDFSEIHPPGSFYGAFYQQGTKFFDQDGVMIKNPEEDEWLEREEKSRAKRGKGDRRDRPPVDSIEAEPTDFSIPEVAESDINLTAWGQGDVEYRFPQVRQAIHIRHGVMVTTVKGACDALVEARVIDPDLRRDRRR